MWVGFVSIKISVFGGENCVKPGNSEYKPGYSGFGTLRGKTPGINPDTPEIPDIPGFAEVWASGCLG